ncbi:TMEM53 family protein [Aspergillus lucknowensis]|uniref:Indole-diterpene biosynthesis protein PaxU n=1 Tax=Aspergillus lucknowensis TaxID=176173 RepID=A0ABR4LZA8_9EURO
MASALNKANYLAPFTQLSPCIYVQEPDTSADDTGDYPRTIVLAFWMNAFSRSLVKYVAEYRRIAPRARIIFIRTSSTEFMLRPTKRAQYARLAPAVELLRSLPPDSSVFFHMFSNGGVFAVTHLLEAYQRATGHPLRVSSTVIDSAPGTATLSGAIKAFSYVLPKQWFLRLFSKMLLYVYLASIFVLGKAVGKLLGIRDAISVARQVINDGRIMRGSNKASPPRRCYIYSDADELVNWEDVESHAFDAESKGFIVRREKFRGSEHVAHMKADPERYWKTVKLYLKDPDLDQALSASST